MKSFKVKLAEVTVKIEHRFDSLRAFCQKFLCDSENEDICVAVSDEQIAKEKTCYDYEISDAYGESTCIFREIAEKMPDYDAFVFHGAAITYKDKAFIFTAPSGTGKSTHIDLWRRHLGRSVDIINGDKPILRYKDGCFEVFGTPWSGKENWCKNRSEKLAAICIIERGDENSVKRMAPGSVVKRLILQTYRPKKTDSYLKTLELLDALITNTPIYLLRCDVSENAVKTSFEALTGEKYPNE